MSGLRIIPFKQQSARVSVNTYLVFDESSGEAAVIDPGGQCLNVLALLQSQKLQLKYIVLTHGHFDHIMCTAELKRETHASVCMNANDESFIGDSELNAANLVKISPIEPFSVDVYLEDGDRVRLGRSYLTVLATPGHTPGSISLYTPGNLICGDTLMRGTTGRMDLPGADMPQICRSIREKIFTLPGDTVVYCGHYAPTTVAYEREHNDTVSAVLTANEY